MTFMVHTILGMGLLLQAADSFNEMDGRFG